MISRSSGFRSDTLLQPSSRMPVMISSDMTRNEDRSANYERVRSANFKLTLESSCDAFFPIACLGIERHSSEADTFCAET